VSLTGGRFGAVAATHKGNAIEKAAKEFKLIAVRQR
jgi:hypothetical protein